MPLTSDNTSTEDLVRAVWGTELGAALGPDDHFFRSGGTSVSAARVTIRLRQRLPVEIDLGLLFDNPVVRDYATRIVGLGGGPPGSRGLAPVDRREPLPLSIQQEARLDRELDAARSGLRVGPYFLPLIIAVAPSVDRAQLQSALDQLLDRHEALRTGFAVDPVAGTRRQRILDIATVPLDVVDPMPGEPRDALITRTYASLVRPIDLWRPPLMRACLLRFGQEESVLVLAIEHIVVDGWSRALLFDELATILRGEPLEPLVPQYVEWAAWQRRRLSGSSLTALLDFWRSSLAGTEPFPRLPLPAPPEGSRGVRAEVTVRLRVTDLERLEHRAKRLGTTLFAVLLTALARAWRELTTCDDVVVHGPTANRVPHEAERIIGNFAHGLVYRVGARPGRTYAAAVDATQHTVAEVLRHQDTPLALLTRRLQPEAYGRASHLPRLFMAHRPTRAMTAPTTAGHVTMLESVVPDPAPEPGLTFLYAQTDGGALAVRIVYRPSETDGRFVDELGARLVAQLESFSGGAE